MSSDMEQCLYLESSNTIYFLLLLFMVGKVFDGTNRAKWSQEVLEWLV